MKPLIAVRSTRSFNYGAPSLVTKEIFDSQTMAFEKDFEKIETQRKEIKRQKPKPSRAKES